MHEEQIRISLRLGELQGALDSHQNSRTERQLFLTGWWTECKEGPQGIYLIPAPLRDRLIKRLQKLFEEVNHRPLELLEISHHYPQKLDSQIRILSAKTLISMTSHEDAKAVQRLLSREHIWTQDPRNVYRSTRIYTQKVFTKREQRFRLHLSLIAQCITCHMWKQERGKPGGKKYGWERACQRFRANLYMHSDGRSLRKKKNDETIALILFDDRTFPTTWDCFVNGEVFKAIQKNWEENVPYYLPSQDTKSVSKGDLDISELYLPPEGKLHNTDAKLVEVAYANPWGQRVLAHYQHAKLYGLFQFIPIEEVTRKYHPDVVPTDLLRCNRRKRART